MRAAAFLLLLAACGPKPRPQPEPEPDPRAQPKPEPPPDPAMAEVLDGLRAHRDRMCACADAACVDDAEVAQFEWGFAHKELVDRAKPTPAQEADATALIEATETCAHALRPDH